MMLNWEMTFPLLLAVALRSSLLMCYDVELGDDFSIATSSGPEKFSAHVL